MVLSHSRLLFCCMHQAGFIGLLVREDSISRRVSYFWSSSLFKVLKVPCRTRDVPFVDAFGFSQKETASQQKSWDLNRRVVLKVWDCSQPSKSFLAFPRWPTAVSQSWKFWSVILYDRPEWGWMMHNRGCSTQCLRLLFFGCLDVNLGNQTIEIYQQLDLQDCSHMKKYFWKIN